MKITLLLAAFVFTISTPAFATCEYINGYAQCDDNIGGAMPLQYPQVGQQIGDTYYGSNGVVVQQNGPNTYIDNPGMAPRVCQTFAGQTTCY